MLWCGLIHTLNIPWIPRPAPETPLQKILNVDIFILHLLHFLIINMSSNKVLDKITYPFPNFNGCKVEVWEWISYFTPHFLMDVITYPKPKGQCGREMDNLDYTLTKLDSRNIEGWPGMGDMQHPYRWAALSIPLEEARNFHSWKWDTKKTSTKSKPK